MTEIDRETLLYIHESEIKKTKSTNSLVFFMEL